MFKKSNGFIAFSLKHVFEKKSFSLSLQIINDDEISLIKDAKTPYKYGLWDREFLVENLRGITWQTYDRSVDVLVSRLRNKLGETPARTRLIKTIHGVGYKFIATPTKK